ncbi:NAD(P)/FAD-dependent oxidoreductase [Streptosporangium saharense]|uniref:Glycine/D-amino acid oxidase-like deaminating enzyme n=1 Tax=Streptosporangium saharense TaxID=1706840 RepID=A0A7W7VR22_9ACTN|nr:FAD-dependent oxidoreductase [Streptosporangium saharense]MBB4919632.1 glycine/D-amino acid oxidase-like deaminating enzyme [Streptosporangium saharense]
MSYDVGIVGAGVHGVSAAFHLARRGVSTVVFDRSTPASGPTGRSGGICRAYYTDPFLAEVAHEGIAFLADFGERTGGGQSGFRRTGAFYLHGPDDVQAARETAARLGPGAETLGPEALPQLETEGVAVAVWEPGAGYADPFATTLGLAEAARGHGAEFLLDRPVVAIEEGARGVTVTTADGSTHHLGTLLVAAGPWTAPLLRPLGVDLPLTVERHVVAILEHDPADAAGLVPYVLIDVAGGYYSTPQPRTQYLVGGVVPASPADPDDFERTVTPEETVRLATVSARRSPARRRAVPVGGWASLYDVSPDWQPVTGRVTEHVLVDAGTSGHGFKLAPAWGEHVARLVLGEADPRLAAFAPSRFEGGGELAAGFGAARILG